MKRGGYAIIVTAVAVGFWLAIDPGGDPGSDPAAAEKAPAPAADPPAATGSNAGPVDGAERRPLSTTSTVRVDVVDADGRPAAGRLGILVSRTPPSFSQGATLDSPWPDPGMQVVSHDGSASIEAGQADWISVHAVGAGGAANLLSPPAPGREHLRLQLVTTQRRARVLVLDTDHFTLVRRGELTVQRPTGEGSGESERIAIDADGVTEVDFGDQDSMRILAPGASDADGEPHGVVVHALPVPAVHEPIVTLVRPADRADLRLELDVEGDPGNAVLLLRRVDDGSMTEVPWRRPLRAGRQVAEWRIDQGDYEVDLWPRGGLSIEDGGALVSVHAETARHALLLRSVPATVRVALVGVDRTKYPVHVITQSTDGVLSARPEGPFLGPWTWRKPEQLVVAASAPLRLVAHGPQGSWIAMETWAGEAGEVAMVPGTQVAIDWQPECVVARAWVEVDSPLGKDVAPLRRGVATVDRRPGPGFVGSCFLPREPFTLTCMADDGKGVRAVWTRRVEPWSARSAVGVRGSG